MRAPIDLSQVQMFARTLDLGESEALSVALEVHADAVLIDEKEGRAFAKQAGLVTIGTLGILIAAKAKGMITEVSGEISRLQSGIGFRISSALLAEALLLAGEKEGPLK